MVTVYICSIQENQTKPIKKSEISYLRAEALHQDGNQQVEQDIVAKRHQRDKIKGCPVARLLHTIKQDHVPIFLG